MLFSNSSVKKLLGKLLNCALLLFLFPAAQGHSQAGPSRKPQLIIDTDAADEKEQPEESQQPKALNPVLAAENIDIGNQYLKKKNYIAAIRRYLVALEYQPDSIQAHDALGRAYEKNGDKTKALELYKRFLDKNPNSSKSADFRERIARLTR
jgi:tetratricopeptide (TPR) repeat protein